MNSIIQVKNFTKRYGDFIAVNDISFDVEEGSIFAFLGPNGAGKSTTINTLCTIFEKTSGSLLIDGKDVTTQKSEVRSAIGVVFQDSTLDAKMTIEENLKMHCVFYNIPSKEVEERIEFVLKLVDLLGERKKMVSALSGGMKRRVEIARGLIHYPKVLFLDEPTTGLDPQTRAHIWEYIIKLQKERNITIFLTTHYMEEAEICNKVAIIDGGVIVAYDTPFALKKMYTKDKAYITTNNEEELERLLAAYHLDYMKKDGYYKAEAEDLTNLLEVLSLHKEFITNIEIKKGTFNDVFLEITGRKIREEA
ncbi:daunorubicin resistance protein DrrA family ABC transporter ATP-binding protein [Anaerocolumna cellulosilytica]|uniref:Daunorubicin resistance protein DrrA family ABC transporter ATP-binding protein n=1 Tax=Anaerocolumna cellulosilytica TaxID=433286 RepID=A0A6S6R5X7_9FIRM|nr:ATP-binding cassette domain-containing protein [Anaerocolumna cellulosilytica]MBB5194061.1 ABC-2 type transport system ATP-binding protein [Anaerocolumna cellulosilytica]BCJ94725.1 daunorubicin resistance protein DrrA family ABC transporter ATP-binding protein [Anaerocolumna cellulosilytica]